MGRLVGSCSAALRLRMCRDGMTERSAFGRPGYLLLCTEHNNDKQQHF